MRKLIIASTLLAPATTFAGGYIIPQENARSIGLSSADTADQNGPEALFNNTAELAGQDGLAIALSGEVIVNRTTWSDPSLGNSTLIPQYGTPPSGAIGYGKHINHDMAFGAGVGVDVPAGGTLLWPNGWQGQEYIQSVKQQVFRISGGVAFQPAPFIKIGATYNRFQVTEELHQSLNFLDHEGDAGLGLSGGANSFGLAIGIHVPTIPLQLGAEYSHSASLELAGDAHFTNVPASFSTLIHDQKVNEALTIPNTLSVGASYAVQPNITLMAAYSWERWSVYDSDHFIGVDGFSVTVPRAYNNAHVYRGGIEWTVSGLPALTLRAGGLRSISPQPTSTISPSLTDGDSTAFSVGAGFSVTPAFRVDFGYQHAWFDQVTASGDEALQGTYATHVDIFSLGLNFRSDMGMSHAAAAAPPPTTSGY